MGIPFIPVRGVYGTDYMKIRPDFQVMANPYDPREELVIVPAIRPEVAVIHGFKGDRLGNALVGPGDNKLLAQASQIVIVTVEEMIDGDLSQAPLGRGQLIQWVYIDALVLAPFGAHPTACPGLYQADRAHGREYIESAQSEEGFKGYLDKYVFEVAGHPGYLARVGLAPAGARRF